MTRGFAGVGALLVAASIAAAQTAAPQLSRTQRDTLRQIVAAVDTASGEPETADVGWQTHILRASDGSHYIAFSVEAPTRLPPATGPLMLYVRLATARLVGQGAERSAVGEWLAGQRSDPLMRPRTGIVIGEMPNLGAGALLDPNRPGRVPPNPGGSNDLRLMQLERERAREEKEARDKKRRAELEGSEQAARDLLPFEDFDLAATPLPSNGAIQRALTAGPGEYELYVAWLDPSAKPPAPIQVLKKTLRLPPANATELAISDVIVADQVGVRAAPYPSAQQAAHPYAIGVTDISARHDLFARRPAERRVPGDQCQALGDRQTRRGDHVSHRPHDRRPRAGGGVAHSTAVHGRHAARRFRFAAGASHLCRHVGATGDAHARRLPVEDYGNRSPERARHDRRHGLFGDWHARVAAGRGAGARRAVSP
jgi:hypothetical protein